MKFLLVCFDRTIALQVLYCLAAAGGEIHVLGSAAVTGLAHSRHCRSLAVHDGDFTEASRADWTRHVNKIADARGIDLIVPGDELAAIVLIQIRAALGVPTFPLPTAHDFAMLANKWSFFAFCSRAGVAVPKTILIGQKSEITLARLEREIGYPLVIKPVDRSNSVGVVVLHSPQEAIGRVIDNPRYSFDGLIAQEFVPGIDIDCSLLASEGRVLCAAVQVREHRAVVFTECETLLEACIALARQAGLNGVAHFDARRDSRTGRVTLIECNPRFWGSIAAAHWCGLNFVVRGVNVAAGRHVQSDIQVLCDGAFLEPGALILAILRLQLANPGLSLASLRGLANAAHDLRLYVATELYVRRRQRVERARLHTAPDPGAAAAKTP